MDAARISSLQSRSWTGCDQTGWKPDGFFGFSRRCVENRSFRGLRLPDRGRTVSTRSENVGLEISRCFKNSPASALESEISFSPVDEALVLEKKAQEAAQYLNGRCIYLVGMMGSGKTTVGKILSEVLGYSFFDSDKLVEQAVGATSVAQIFKDHK